MIEWDSFVLAIYEHLVELHDFVLTIYEHFLEHQKIVSQGSHENWT